MQAAMADINAQNEAEGLPAINTGIAINTGDVIAGNIGSERRSKYGFVGHPMNVTSRMEDLTAGGEILVADSTLASLSGRYTIGESREINVKGIDETLLVHSITGEQT
jgi:class 3 adenylate cyclase